MDSKSCRRSCAARCSRLRQVCLASKLFEGTTLISAPTPPTRFGEAATIKLARAARPSAWR